MLDVISPWHSPRQLECQALDRLREAPEMKALAEYLTANDMC